MTACSRWRTPKTPSPEASMAIPSTNGATSTSTRRQPQSRKAQGRTRARPSGIYGAHGKETRPCRHLSAGPAITRVADGRLRDSLGPSPGWPRTGVSGTAHAGAGVWGACGAVVETLEILAASGRMWPAWRGECLPIIGCVVCERSSLLLEWAWLLSVRRRNRGTIWRAAVYAEV